MHYYIAYKIKRQSSGATIAFESREARHGPPIGEMLTRRRKRCSMSSPHQLSWILLFIHISLFAPVAQGSDQQARWLQSYRMRLEELKAHEERRLQQGTSDVHDSVSTFHVKVSCFLCHFHKDLDDSVVFYTIAHNCLFPFTNKLNALCFSGIGNS